MILPTAYFPNIFYLTQVLNSDVVEIDVHENFVKKTYRNRCEILTSNGKLGLTVPILKSREAKQRIQDVRIDYSTDWQKQHFKSIESAYQSSPFYEYIIDDFKFVFEQKTEFLIDLNRAIQEELNAYINFETHFLTTKKYHTPNTSEYLRRSFKPNNPYFTDFPYQEYYQTFGNKFDFVPNLSVLDLLFNCGPRAKDNLQDCLEKQIKLRNFEE